MARVEGGKRTLKEIEEDDDDDQDELLNEVLGFGGVDDKKTKKGKKSSSSAVGGSSGGGAVAAVSCQAENCSSDMGGARRYYRRHKVCEVHARAPVVLVAGVHQRFCQQCSRVPRAVGVRRQQKELQEAPGWTQRTSPEKLI
ncbi:Squamosa promoter-binding protein 1 [Linum perenne]